MERPSRLVDRPKRRDCPECRAVDSVVLGLCSVCFAELDEGGPIPISAGLSWDLDLDEPLLPEPRGPLGS